MKAKRKSRKSNAPQLTENKENDEGPEIILKQILKLNTHRKQMEEEKNFVEAGQIKTQLNSLGEDYKESVIINLQNKHEQEVNELEIQYQKEMEKLELYWEEKRLENEEEMEKILANI